MLSFIPRPAGAPLLGAFLALALLLPCGAGIAQTAPANPQAAAEPAPSHLALARQLIDETNTLGSVDEMLVSFTEEIRRQAVTRPELAKDLDAVLKSLEPELKLQRQQVFETVARTYAKWLSEAELREVVAFFKTPAGSKYIRSQPDLVEDVINRVQAWSQEASEYVTVRVRAEMLKRGFQMN